MDGRSRQSEEPQCSDDAEHEDREHRDATFTEELEHGDRLSLGAVVARFERDNAVRDPA